jgi:chitodextrinase
MNLWSTEWLRGKRGLVLRAAAVSVLVAWGAHPVSALAGLVAAYGFNEGSGTVLTDLSGNGNNGTISGATWTTSGKFGSALVFNGSSAVATIADAPSLRLTNAMTLEAWVSPSTVSSAWRDVLYKADDNYYLEGTTDHGGVPCGAGTFGTADVGAFGMTVLALNTWAHLATTYDGATLRFYVNGVQVSTLAQTGNMVTSANPLQIGGDTLYGQHFAGTIDEVRVYNVALSAAQIQSDMNTPVGAGPDTQAPSAPASLTATAVSQSQINLSWAASTDNVGVTGYLVERENPGTVTFVQVGTATGTTYNDTGLAVGTNYSYRVRATDAAGNLSGYSPVASATTLAPDTQAPSAPASLTATAVSGAQINLSWAASTDNVGVTGYMVERENPGTVTFVQVGTATATTYSDTGLAPSTNYSYRVRATDAAGNLSTYSPVASATTLAAPSGLVAAYGMNEGSGTVLTDSSGNGNNGTISGATWTTSGKFGSALVFNGSSAVVTIADAPSLRLSNAMTLEAWVSPSTVSSAWRDVVYKANDNYYLEGTTDHGGGVPCGAGTFGTADVNAFGTSVLALNTWAHLATTYDGATLRFYVNGVQVSSLAQTGKIVTSANPLQIGGDNLYGQHFAGTIDEVRVYNVALSAAQIQADMSTPISPIVDTQPPTAPSNLAANGVGGTQVQLSWTASADNVGVTGYLLERQNPGSGSFVQVATTTTTSYFDTGLTGPTNYSYRVRATDAAGNLSAYSGTATATTLAGAVASDNFNRANGALGANWSKPIASADNLIVTNNQVGVDVEDVHNYAYWSANSFSNDQYAQAVIGKIGAWTGVILRADGVQDRFYMAFVFAANDYRIYSRWDGAYYSLSTGTSVTWQAGDIIRLEVTGSADPVTLTMYRNGTPVLSWVSTGSGMVKNGGSAGLGIYSPAGMGLTMDNWEGGNLPGDTQAPSAPASLTATAVSSSQINLSWAASTDNVGVTGYMVERENPGTTSFVQVGTATGTTYSDTGLAAGTNYSYRVRATDAAGNLSAYSPVASATTLAPDTQAPSAPASLTATAVSQSQINLSWSASTDNVGVTGYLVERENPGTTSFVQVGTATATTYSDTGLAAGTNYSYRVRATDAAGNLSTYSPVASATTQAPDTQAPSAPASLTATAVSSSQINLSWAASTDNVGVTGYMVERENPGTATFVQVGTATATTYNDTGLAAGTNYSYRVRATDAAGNLSTYSPVASATTLAATTGLVAAYGFNEGSGTVLTDLSGNGNNGTISGATWTTSGKFGSALVFNGSSAVVTIADAPSLRLSNAMTLEAWVSPSTVSSAWRDVVYKADDNYYLEGTTDHGGVPCGAGTFGTADVGAFGTTVLTLNTWAHLATTYDGATLRFYVNGVQVSSLAQTGKIVTSANPLQIGGDNLYGQHFAGTIDEVRVYNVALSAAQIQSDMNTPVGAGPDTQAPSAPASLTATAASQSQINLSWSASTDNVGVTGYLVERENPGTTSFVQVGTATGTTYNDTGLAVGTNYSYRVRATDAAGNLSGYSPVASATTLAPDTQAPSAPASLAATAVSSSQINLSWSASTDNVGVTGYLVERENPGTVTFVQVGTATATTYSDTGLAPSTNYSYRVRATDAAGNLSTYSPVASATTQAAASGLVAAYAFNEGSGTVATDLSGNGNNGTISGATWTGSGKYGSALVFNGSSAVVTIADAPSLRLSNAMTLEAWVSPSTVSSAWRDVVYKANDNYYLEGTTDHGGGVPCGAGTFGTADVGAFGTTVLTLNTWAHLATTYDGATLRFYVNGVQVSSLAQTGKIVTSANPLQIGGDSLYGQHFAGTIDEVRVYNVALSAAQIQADMNAPLGAVVSAPGNLTAVATGGTQVNLNWSASTGTLNVSGYLVERCQGVGCNSFAQIGTTTSTSYGDTGLTPNTTYNYRVRAVDTGGDMSAYSAVAQAYTGISVSPRVAAVTFTQPQQFSASLAGVTWSVDGVSGGGASSGTISASGLYTPPASVASHVVTATSSDQTEQASATVYVSNFGGKYTQNNDNFRTGQNLNEVALTPANVNAGSFGRLFSYVTDGVSHASPLYVANVNIPGVGYRNVVYVATEHDSVFAFDADGRSSSAIWHVSFINPANGVTTVPANDTGECCDISPEIGITGTPVIDAASRTLYVVAKTKEVVGSTTSYVQRLHALDITTGAEKFGGPMVIQGSVSGSGTGSSGGNLAFDALRENQRPALLLNNGVIYMGFSSHGDLNPWHGWVLGYSAATLQQVTAHSVTPDGYGGGIWQSGGGLGGDSAGSVYYVSGNGPFDVNTGGRDYGDSFVKLGASGAVADYFTPHTQATLESQNWDLGSGGLLLLPDQPGSHTHMLLAAGKDGTIYLVDRDNMGHYNANNDSQIVQSLVNVFSSANGATDPGNNSAPVYFNGSVYFSPIADTVKAFSLSNGLLSTAPTSHSAQTYAWPGGSLAVSANGSANGILWAIQYNSTTAPGVLYAYNAANLGTELYDSNQMGARDGMDFAAKYTAPVVANGKVFVCSVGQLAAYGLLP